MMTEVNADSLLDKIRNDLAPKEGGAVELDTELLMSGLIDSLGIVDLVGWLEDRLRVEIDPAEIVIENFETPRAVLALVERLGIAE